jgi:iron complex outermembrane receptor protein
VFGTSLAPGSCGTVDDIPGSPTNFLTLVTTGGDPNLAFHPYKDDVDTNKWQWKAGIDYSFNDDILTYFTISTGFKSGGFNGANSNAQSQLLPYKEEELTSYELGVKATLLEGAMQLNAATFFYDYEDKQEQDLAVTFVGNISGLTNVPKSEVKGAELELRWLPVEGLSLDFGAAWLDTKVKEWMAVDPSSAWPTVIYFDASGGDLAMSPEWQYNATAAYEWNISCFKAGVAADYSYKDDTAGPFVSQAIESYQIVNLRISLGSQDDKWRTMLWSKNLLDEDYFVAAYVGNGPYSRVNGMPRTYGVTLEYNF